MANPEIENYVQVMAKKTEDYVPLNDAADAAIMAAHASLVAVNLPKINRVEISRVANGFIVRLEPHPFQKMYHPGTVCDGDCHVFADAKSLGEFLSTRLK